MLNFIIITEKPKKLSFPPLRNRSHEFPQRVIIKSIKTRGGKREIRGRKKNGGNGWPRFSLVVECVCNPHAVFICLNHHDFHSKKFIFVIFIWWFTLFPLEGVEGLLCQFRGSTLDILSRPRFHALDIGSRPWSCPRYSVTSVTHVPDVWSRPWSRPWCSVTSVALPPVVVSLPWLNLSYFVNPWLYPSYFVTSVARL